MSKIKLVNKNGKIVGIDPDTGNEVPVEVDDLAATTLITESSPRVDIRAFGAVGDGSTDDTNALRDAVDAAVPNGCLHIPTDMTLRLSGTVDIDLGLPDDEIANENPSSLTNFSLICRGAIKPDSGVDPAIEIHNGAGAYVSLRVSGGGDPSSPTANRALEVRDMLGGYYEGVGRNYEGVLINVNDGDHFTGYVTLGRVLAIECGQAILLDESGTSESTVGFGEIENVWDYNPVKALESSWSDVSINQYENFVGDRTTQGVVLSGTSVWIDKLAVGGSASVTNLDVSVNRLAANMIYANQGLNGVDITGSNKVNANIWIRNPSSTGLFWDGSFDDSDVWLCVDGAGTRGIFGVGAHGGNRTRISGKVINSGDGTQPAIDFENSNIDLTLDEVTLNNNNVTSDVDCPIDTGIDIIGGDITDISTGNVRTFNYIRGGGPSGGVDLGATAGNYIGEFAVSDGSTKTADKLYRWDGSAWNLVA